MMFYYAVVACFAVAACSLTLTRSRMFMSLRVWLKHSRYVPTWFYLLWRCPYCMSHWLSLALIAWVSPFSSLDSYLLWLVQSFALVGGSALLIGLILFFLPFDSEE
jgi:hypothetical protein